MGSCPGGELFWWGVVHGIVLVGNCLGEELSSGVMSWWRIVQWGVVLVGNSNGVISWWRIVQWGVVLVGNSSGVMSWWGIVQWGVVLVGICPVGSCFYMITCIQCMYEYKLLSETKSMLWTKYTF